MIANVQELFLKRFLVISALVILCAYGKQRPNIIFILADDLGWNDVGFHGSAQIPTPNLDALAYSGIILNNYYVTPICTPSRSALMTGKHPIHTGMQHVVLYGAEPRGLPLSEKILPQYLNDLGYASHIVGKWHLGSYKKVYTPLYRGFLSHLGFWTGHQDYFDHTAMEKGMCGLDMRRNMDVAWDLSGQYCTDIFAKEAVKIIDNHNKTNPLFLYFAHAAVHSGNPYDPLPAPNDTVANFNYIKNSNRRRFAGMLKHLDDSVGEVIEALERNEMLDNSIVIFSTDNGGPAAGFNINAASNWPLRGTKNTPWEGGVRGVGLVWSPLIAKPQRVATQKIHITDWLPTLLTAGGGSTSVLKSIDGIDLWNSLSHNKESPRIEVLHYIDDIEGVASLSFGDWKIIKGTTYKGQWDSWYGPSGRKGYYYNITEIAESPTGKVLIRQNNMPNAEKIRQLRSEAQLNCTSADSAKRIKCLPLNSPCLFNIAEDPCEENNLASLYPNILQWLEHALQKLNSTAVPPANLPIDERGDPKYWNNTYTNFGDYISNIS
ncbi:arylsulfatase B [Agrilus planipennis]|uniref:Arylsulfatase B n=1 Tax=Agrilus planipennis TaxID=224129 RepID=A0A1W4X523_AGRPL|nr:arylsulfatase B [Agrilus planipennis]